jgi:hypothetical protein
MDVALCKMLSGIYPQEQKSNEDHNHNIKNKSNPL